jgi:hypothetical protein
LDPRLTDEKKTTGPVKEFEEIQLNEWEPNEKIKIRTRLMPKNKTKIITCLWKNKDVFTWCYGDIVGINFDVMCHRLNIDPEHPRKRQKRHFLSPERYQALKEEVNKLMKIKFIKEAKYLVLVFNPVLVPKPNGK